jgi:hypothetical protein
MAVLPSPLSSSIDGINQSTVSGNIFGGDRQDPETKSKLQSLTSSIGSLQNQVNELSKNNITNIGVFSNFEKSFSNQIGNVKSQLDKVNDTLESVATTISSESVIERQKDLIEQENQKRLAESGARGGQESLLETKIQSALSEPLSRIGNTVSFGFQNLMSFISTLLGGWLTLEGIKTIKAYQDDDKNKLDDIKNSVIKTLGIAGGIFLIINVGIVKVIGTLVGLVGKIGKFLINNTIGKVFQGASSVIKGATRAVTGAGAREAAAATKGAVAGSEKSVAGKVFGNIGKIFKGVGKFASPLINPILGAFDFMQRKGEGQTNVQAGSGAASSVLASEAGIKIGSKFPGWTKLLAMPLLGAGGYVLGGMGSDKLTGVDKPKETKTLEVAPPKENKTPEVAPPKENKTPEVAPVTPMIPPASNLQINQPDPKRVKQYEQAWQNKDNPLARKKIEGAWNNMSSEEKQQAKNWATSKGYDWKEMKLPDIDTSGQKAPEITPAEVSKVPTVPFNIGPEPELKPNIVYASSGSSAPQQQPLKSGPASDVPFISSSNPDNFYALYSQINYNIIT